MSEITSSLGVAVRTGEASAELDKLRRNLEGAATGVRSLGMAVKTHSAAIQSMLSGLSRGGFKGLSEAVQADLNKTTRVMQTFKQKLGDGYATAGLGAGKAFGSALGTGIKSSSADAVRIAADTVRRLEAEVDKARPAKIGGALGGGLSSSIKKDLDKVPAMYAEMFTRVQSDVEKGLRVNMRTLRDMSGTFDPGMQAAIAKTLDYERQMIEAHGMNMKAQKKQENALFAALEKEKLNQQKQALNQWLSAEKVVNAEQMQTLAQRVAAEREASASIRAARKEYVGKTGSLGGFATATATKPIKEFKNSFSASSALGAQRDGALRESLNNAGDAADKSKPKLKAWSDEAKLVHDTARGAAAGVGYLWMTWGNIGAMAAGFTAIRGVSAGIKELANIEKQLTFAAQAGGGTVEGLSKRIMDMYGNGQKMVHTAGDMSEALKNLTLAGFSTDDAFKMLTSTYKFAAAGELDLAEAAQGIQQTMNSFSLPMGETARVTDVLAKAAASSAVTISDMVEAMKSGSVVGSLYGVSIEDFAKSTAMLGQVGIVGSSAGTAIKNFYAEVSSPKSKAAQQAMVDLGLSFYQMQDGVVKLKPLSGIMDELRTKFRGLAASDQKAFFENAQKLFNERGIKEAARIIKMTDEEFQKLNGTLADSAGFVDTLYSKLTKTTTGIYSDAQAQGMASLTLAVKEAEPAIQSLGESLVRVGSSPEFRSFLSTTVKGIAYLTQLLVDHGKTILTVVATYAAFKASAGILALALTAVRALTMGMQTLYYTSKLTAAGQATLLLGTRGYTGVVGALATKSMPSLLGALGGVARALPVIGGLLTAGMVLWELWGKNAQSAGEKARRAAKDAIASTKSLHDELERNRKAGQMGVNGQDMLRTLDEIEKHKRAIANMGPIAGKNQGNDFAQKRRAEYDEHVNAIRIASADYDRLKKEGDAAAAVTAAPTAQGPITNVIPTNTGTPDKGALTEAKNIEKENLEARIQQAQSAGKTLLDELKHQQALGQLQETEFNKRSFEIKDKALLAEYNLNLAYYKKMKALGKGSEAKDALTKVEASRIAIEDNQQEFKQGKELIAKREKDSVRDFSKGISDSERESAFQEDLERAPDYLKSFYSEWEKLTNETQTLIDKAEQEGRAFSVEAQTEIWSAVGARLMSAWDQANQMGPERLKSMIDEFKAGVAAKAQEMEANVSLGSISQEAARDKLNAFIRDSGRELLKLSKTDLTKLIDSMGLSASAAAALKANVAGVVAEIDKAGKTSAFDGLIAGAKSYGANVGSVFERMKGISEQTFKSMEDALTSYVMTGKADFKSLVGTVLEGLARIAAQQAIMAASEALGLGSSKSGSGGGSGIDWGGIAKTVGSFIFSAQGNVFTGTTGLSKFTNSIVTQPTAFAFAKGGIPNMGVMGEKPGSPGEAIMPLTRMPGGDLGVKVSGAGGGGAGSQIAVSITINDQRTQTETKGTGDNETAKKLADMIKGVVYSTINKEIRPGGILA